jgi:hypothetical protein
MLQNTVEHCTWIVDSLQDLEGLRMQAKQNSPGVLQGARPWKQAVSLRSCTCHQRCVQHLVQGRCSGVFCPAGCGLVAYSPSSCFLHPPPQALAVAELSRTQPPASSAGAAGHADALALLRKLQSQLSGSAEMGSKLQVLEQALAQVRQVGGHDPSRVESLNRPSSHHHHGCYDNRGNTPFLRASRWLVPALDVLQTAMRHARIPIVTRMYHVSNSVCEVPQSSWQ